MIHRMGCWVVPSSSWMLSFFMVSPGACLRHCHLLWGCPVIIVVGFLELFPSRTGTLFFIAVYSVGVLNDLV